MGQDNPNIALVEQFLKALQITCGTKFAYKITQGRKEIPDHESDAIFIETSEVMALGDGKNVILLEALKNNICHVVTKSGEPVPDEKTVGMSQYKKKESHNDYTVLGIDISVLELSAVHKMLTSGAARAAQDIKAAFLALSASARPEL